MHFERNEAELRLLQSLEELRQQLHERVKFVMAGEFNDSLFTLFCEKGRGGPS